MKSKKIYDKGIIFDVKRYAIHDGPGIRTTIFLKGCPLDCWWCQNPESRDPIPQSLENFRPIKGCALLNSSEKIGVKVSVDEIMTEIKKDILFYDESLGGVTFSGGEPLQQPEFLYQLLLQCQEEQIHTVVDTCGYAPLDDYKLIEPLVNLFLYDLKIADTKEHQKYTGVSNIRIHDNLNWLDTQGADLQIRIPLIPQITDTAGNISQLIEILGQLKRKPLIELLTYNPLGEGKYERMNKEKRAGHLREQETEKMEQIKSLFYAAGLPIIEEVTHE